MKEIIEMVQDLLEMSMDTYMKCRYVLLAVSADHQGTYDFVNKLFEFTDRHRPLHIEMKEYREDGRQ